MKINDNLSSKHFALLVIAFASLLTFAIPNSVMAQGTIESEAASTEETSRDPITIINDIRDLLTQSNNAYVNQNFTGAEELARTAYLDHYEYLEGPLAALDPALMESTELLIREDLITAIQERAAVTVIQDLFNTINNNLNQAELLFQQQ